MTSVHASSAGSRGQLRTVVIVQREVLEMMYILLCCCLKDGCSNVGRGKYLSVFLELKNGFAKSSTYEYRIQLLWQGGREASKDLVREHGRGRSGGWVKGRMEGGLGVECDSCESVPTEYVN